MRHSRRPSLARISASPLSMAKASSQAASWCRPRSICISPGSQTGHTATWYDTCACRKDSVMKVLPGYIVGHPWLGPVSGLLLGTFPLIMLGLSELYDFFFVAYLFTNLPYALEGYLLHIWHLFEYPSQQIYYSFCFVCITILTVRLLLIPLLRHGYKRFSYAFLFGCVLTSIFSSLFQGWRVSL